MKKIILSIFFILLSVLFVIVKPDLAAGDQNERWSEGGKEYSVQRDGNNIALTLLIPKATRAAGIPSLVGTINGTTFTGKQYLLADGCPNLEGYVPASGTVSADGNSVTVRFKVTDFYSSSCTEKPNSDSEVTKTYSIVSKVSKSPAPQPSSKPVQDPFAGFAEKAQCEDAAYKKFEKEMLPICRGACKQFFWYGCVYDPGKNPASGYKCVENNLPALKSELEKCKKSDDSPRPSVQKQNDEEACYSSCKSGYGNCTSQCKSSGGDSTNEDFDRWLKECANRPLPKSRQELIEQERQDEDPNSPCYTGQRFVCTEAPDGKCLPGTGMSDNFGHTYFLLVCKHLNSFRWKT